MGRVGPVTSGGVASGDAGNERTAWLKRARVEIRAV